MFKIKHYWFRFVNFVLQVIRRPKSDSTNVRIISDEKVIREVPRDAIDPRDSFNWPQSALKQDPVHEDFPAQASIGGVIQTESGSLPEEDGEWMRGRLFAEIDLFLRNQRSPHTQRAYRNDLKQFIGFLRQTKSAPNLDVLIRYREWLVAESEAGGRQLNKSSANRKIACVRSFLSWLQGRGEIRENQAKWLKSFTAKRVSTTEGLSNVQVAAMLEAPNLNLASGQMHALVLHFLFYFGLRRSELVGIKLSDFFVKRAGEETVLTLRVLGKGDRERVLPLTKATEALLKNYIDRRGLILGSAGYLFRPVRNNVSGNKQKHIDAEAVAYIVRKYARKVGVEARITPHSCRATCISNALEQGASHKSVQEMAGWSSPLMIERYDKRRLELKRSAVYKVDYGQE